MTPFVVYEVSNGRIKRHGMCQETDFPNQAKFGEGVISEVIVSADMAYVFDGLLVGAGPRPSESHTFNYDTKQWEDLRTLQDLKAAQWEAIKQARSAAEYAGFTWDGSTFDSDATSQNRITGAVTLAQMSPAFSVDWIPANNTVRTLTQADMLQVGAALGAHVAAQFATGVTRRAQIEAATTKEAVEAITWSQP